jgi:hypothetical protein
MHETEEHLFAIDNDGKDVYVIYDPDEDLYYGYVEGQYLSWIKDIKGSLMFFTHTAVNPVYNTLCKLQPNKKFTIMRLKIRKSRVGKKYKINFANITEHKGND